MTRANDFLFIREDKHGMLNIVVGLQIALWLESHQRHTDTIKFLDLFDLLLRELDFLSTNWIERADLRSVKSFTGLIADVAISRAELGIVLGVHSLDRWFLSWEDCTEETKSNL